MYFFILFLVTFVGAIFATTLCVNCSFISCIEDVMFKIYFVEMFRSTMDICVIGYYILSVFVKCIIIIIIKVFLSRIYFCILLFHSVYDFFLGMG